MFGLEIIVGILEKKFRAVHEFRVGIAQTQNGTLVGRRGLRVHVGIVRKGGVRVVVVDRNLVDLLQKSFVDLRHVRARERPRLPSRIRSPSKSAQQPTKSACSLYPDFSLFQSPKDSTLPCGTDIPVCLPSFLFKLDKGTQTAMFALPSNRHAPS